MATTIPLTDEARENLISEYVTREIARMSIKEMKQIIGDQLEENLRYLSDDELNAIIGE